MLEEHLSDNSDISKNSFIHEIITNILLKKTSQSIDSLFDYLSNNDANIKIECAELFRFLSSPSYKLVDLFNLYSELLIKSNVLDAFQFIIQAFSIHYIGELYSPLDGAADKISIKSPRNNDKIATLLKNQLAEVVGLSIISEDSKENNTSSCLLYDENSDLQKLSAILTKLGLISTYKSPTFYVDYMYLYTDGFNRFSRRLWTASDDQSISINTNELLDKVRKYHNLKGLLLPNIGVIGGKVDVSSDDIFLPPKN